MKYSDATYLDAGSATKRDYSNVRRVLDSALTGSFNAGGNFLREKVVKNMHVFHHITEVPCVKQPAGGQKEAYYARM